MDLLACSLLASIPALLPLVGISSSGMSPAKVRDINSVKRANKIVRLNSSIIRIIVSTMKNRMHVKCLTLAIVQMSLVLLGHRPHLEYSVFGWHLHACTHMMCCIHTPIYIYICICTSPGALGHEYCEGAI